MTTMSFKTFTFPHNPEKITVTTETRIATRTWGWPGGSFGRREYFTGPTPRPSTPPWRP